MVRIRRVGRLFDHARGQDEATECDRYPAESGKHVVKTHGCLPIILNVSVSSTALILYLTRNAEGIDSCGMFEVSK